MSEGLDTFYLKQKEPNQSCLLALRNILLNFDNKLTETLKYGLPCFCYSNKMFCYLWKDKKTTWPYILFVDGDKLSHPSLDQGTRKRMKVLSINPNIDIPMDTLNTILNEAIRIRKEATK
jgi:hypothetical protein